LYSSVIWKPRGSTGPESPDDLRPQQLPRKKPRPHQRQAISHVLKGFQESDRGQLIMACGTGKTLTALFVTEELAAERTLVLVPSLSLLAQTLREWTANGREAFDFLPVCSDQTVADDDAVVANTSELGFPVTTDQVTIADFLRKKSGKRIVFATYQSSPQVAAAFQLSRVHGFDLAVADEAHRCAGPVTSEFSTILDSDAIKASRRLFMTATPRYFTGRVIREAKASDFEVASMDDETVFGPVFHRLGFADAIKKGLLTDYQVAVVGVDDDTYCSWAQKGRFVNTDDLEVVNARALAGQIGLAKALRDYGLRRTISFHSRVKRAREFAHSLPGAIAWMPADQRPSGRLWADYASGEMAAGQRLALLQHLRTLDDDERGLLANARCLAEGIDVPTLDGVAFIDPKRSEVDIVQAVGRAIRRAADKKIGTIVLPVFINTNDDPAVALDDPAFKAIWDVIKALRAHDDELGEQLDGLRRKLGRLGHGGKLQLPAKIRLNLPESVGAEFVHAIDVRIVEQTTASWEFWFGLLERFVNQQGDVEVPRSVTMDGYALGEWVKTQRSFHSRGALSPDRQNRLEQLPDWTWDPFESQWEEGFNNLLQYVEKHGHALVAASEKFNGFNLGRWVTVQRVNHEKRKIEPERQRRLETVEGWTWRPRSGQWEEGYKRLREYVHEHGHALVSEPSPVSCALPLLGRMARCRSGTTRTRRPGRCGWSASTATTTTASGRR
jgi:superfamily II DNA or RNA helicase